jgi:hypothetical protein
MAVVVAPFLDNKKGRASVCHLLVSRLESGHESRRGQSGWPRSLVLEIGPRIEEGIDDRKKGVGLRRSKGGEGSSEGVADCDRKKIAGLREG